MRADTKVEGKSVVVIWTSNAVQYSSFNVTTVNSAVRASGLGKTQEKRDLLKTGSTDTAIVTKENSVRRSCIALYMNDHRWPKDLLNQIAKGQKVTFTSCNCDHYYMYLN
jgi:hypothetical protein